MNSFNWDGASEADVREELIAPLLYRLGYARGTSFDIVREQTLRYDRVSLGRKKSSDVKLQGRLDYLLKIIGGPRWILEAKPPHEALADDAVAQALSYARHPEVSAVFVALTNGLEFLLYDVTQRPTDRPLVRLEVRGLNQIYDSLAGILTPGAIKRSFPLPEISVEKPIAPGLRGAENMSGGFIRCLWTNWRSNLPDTDDYRENLDELCRRLIGFQSDITKGKVHRTGEGRIIAEFEWTAPHAQLQKFAFEKNLMKYKYVCLDEAISTDENNPTTFDFCSEMSIEEGDELFDIVAWETRVNELAQVMTISGQATGYLKDEVFCGLYESLHIMKSPLMPEYSIEVLVEGSFEIYLSK